MIIFKFLRYLLTALDTVVYWAVGEVYQLLMKLSEVGIFDPNSIGDFAKRIYFFLGLAMLFKVSISIVNYIMNPDLVKDNKTGAGKLIKNVIIILVGIVTVPYIFEAAYSLQRIVLKEGIIPNLVLGVKYSDANNAKSVSENAGNMMAFTTFTAFFHLNEDYFTQECYADPIDHDTGDWTKACSEDSIGKAHLDKVGKYKNAIRAAYEEKSVAKLLANGVVAATFMNDGEEIFLFNYMYLLTTIGGAYLVWILLAFCIDIALRSVKLGFLQLIAPVPLIAKIDPKKGDDIFNKWIKECISTYLSLFGRLIAIYFAIFIISSLDGTYNIVDGTPEHNVFVKLFILFGTLLFVKDLPKLIETLTGIKVGDASSLSFSKRLGDVAKATPPIIGNTARKTIAGLDAKRNGMKFKTGWDKERANDKGDFADIRRTLEKALPYTTATRKTNLENREKSEENKRNLAIGQEMLRNIKGNSGYVAKDPTPDDKKKNHMLEAQEIFKNVRNKGIKDEAIHNYQEMANLKDARDSIQSQYEKMKMSFENGIPYKDENGVETNLTVEEVDNARIAYTKASAKYDKASAAFKDSIMGDSEASKAYAQYTQADDASKLYGDQNSPADATKPAGANVETVGRGINNRANS